MFDDGRNRRKPFESGWGRVEHSPHAMIVEVGGLIDDYYASLTPQGIAHDGHPSRYQPCPTWLNFGV